MAREIVILGATGSIGKSTLDVIDRLGEEYHAAAVTANTNWEEMVEICRKYKPQMAVMNDGGAAQKLKDVLNGTGIEVLSGSDGLERAASLDEADTVITGIVGGDGLRATLAAVRAGKRVGVANKEPFVMAGRLITQAAETSNCEIVPVDSEHSAIYQCLKGERSEGIYKIHLTGSGGPFRTIPLKELERVTPEEALNHPTWNMGPKITIDSATMMNKALELIEAKWLFGVEASQIDVVVHPQSIIHSMVEFIDGSVIAQLGFPDMKVPIQYAISTPERLAGDPVKMNFAELGKLTFEKPDLDKYPSIRLGSNLLKRKGDCWGIIINAADEVAVQLFLERKIPFTSIMLLIEKAVDYFAGEDELDLDGIFELDKNVREYLLREF